MAEERDAEEQGGGKKEEVEKRLKKVDWKG